MSLYDEEMVINDLEVLFKAKLNTEIDLINTEKSSVPGDLLYIENIADDKYIFETLDDSIKNFKGFFIMYGLQETPIRDAQLNNYIEDTTITFQVATFDRGNKARANDMYKLLRYRKALKRVIMKNSDVFHGYAKPLIGSLNPSAFPYDSRNVILTIGIDIKASMTAN